MTAGLEALHAGDLRKSPVPASPASPFGPAAKTDHSDAQLLYCAGALWQISLRAAFRRDWVGSYKVVVLGGGGAGTCTR